MDRTLKVTISETMDVPVSAVWKALTDSAIIKRFMWGTNATSDWKKGSPLIFEGEYEGKSYREKGTILEIEKAKLMKYTYLSSGLEDKPENYAIITYALTGNETKTTLTVTQEGAKNQEALEHSKSGWKSILGTLKKIMEE
jgi:uncharacterized protein YndB with AHSA1/START domain